MLLSKITRSGLVGFGKQKGVSIPLSLKPITQVKFFSTESTGDFREIKTKGSKKVRSPLITKLLAYTELVKFKLTLVVASTTAAGYLLAGGPVDYTALTGVCAGTALCSFSAATWNELFEKDIDAVMNRTKLRPIPAGQISPREAAVIGSVAGLGGTAMLLTLTNPTTALLGFGNILLYSGIYTYSKQKTEWNTHIGAVVGAVPPVMGWAAATNTLLAPEPALIASLLFLWQMPHFFALAWLYREDYAKGGFQMVSVNDPTGQRTAKLISNYSTSLLLVPVVATGFGETGSMFLVEGVLATVPFLYLSSEFSKNRSQSNARKIFGYSLLYILLVCAGMVFHSKNWSPEAIEAKQREEAGEVLHNGSNSEEEPDKITDFVLKSKGTLKEYCVHERIAKQEDNVPHLCPKKVTDQTIDSIESIDIAAGTESLTTVVSSEEVQSEGSSRTN